MRLFENTILALRARPAAPAPDARSRRFSSTALASVRALSGAGRPQLFSSRPDAGALSKKFWDVKQFQPSSTASPTPRWKVRFVDIPVMLRHGPAIPTGWHPYRMTTSTAVAALDGSFVLGAASVLITFVRIVPGLALPACSGGWTPHDLHAHGRVPGRSRGARRASRQPESARRRQLRP